MHWAKLIVAASIVCSSVPSAQQQPAGEAAQAEQAYRALEEKLLGAAELRISARVWSSGEFESSLEGSVVLRRPNVAFVDVEGTFGRNVTSLHLDSNGRQLRGGSEAGAFDQATPSALNESIIIGLTRMGLLHNFARLTAGAPPDHMDGGVQGWVEVVDFALGDEQDVEGRDLRPIIFRLVVDGQPAGEASLWIDPETGWPLQRIQTVRFDTGVMHVTEIYEIES